MPTTTPARDAPFALADHALLSLTGPDALAFAQAQAMNDVAALGDGQWQWNGWLTPKGRVIALFALLRRDAQTLWLLLPDGDAEVLVTALRRFVFRSKVQIAVRDDLRVCGAFAAPRQALAASMAEAGDTVELDFDGEGGPRTLRIGTSAGDGDAASLARWRALDIAHGLPRLDPDQRERWTPQQLSLERLRAFSVKKGCYPGQEIVARTHFLGQAKRGLVRLRGTGVGELDEVMANEPAKGVLAMERPIGQMVCAAADEGLAVMPHESGDGPLSTGGAPCVVLPLLGGLAR